MPPSLPPFSLELEAARLAEASSSGVVVVSIDEAGIQLQHADVSVEGMMTAGAAALIAALAHAKEGAATCAGCAGKVRRLNAALDALCVSQAARTTLPHGRVTH